MVRKTRLEMYVIWEEADFHVPSVRVTIASHMMGQKVGLLIGIQVAGKTMLVRNYPMNQKILPPLTSYPSTTIHSLIDILYRELVLSKIGQVPYRMKIYKEFHLVTWLRLVKFTVKDIGEF